MKEELRFWTMSVLILIVVGIYFGVLAPLIGQAS